MVTALGRPKEASLTAAAELKPSLFVASLWSAANTLYLSGCGHIRDCVNIREAGGRIRGSSRGSLVFIKM